MIEGNLNGHNVRQFGHSRSDSFDACESQVKPVVYVTFILCNLAHVTAWHRPCPQVKVVVMFGVSRTLPGMKLTVHE